MNRVLVIGSGGSGKTTLARRIAEHTGLPLIHLDGLYWRSGWDPTPADEWRRRVQELIAGDTWIMDGNYGGTLDIRLAAADTVIFLDLSRWTCLWRVAKRQLQHRRTSRDEMPAGCPERLTWEFITWIWSYPKTRRGPILRRLAELGDRKHVVILRSPKDVERFLSGLSES